MSNLKVERWLVNSEIIPYQSNVSYAWNRMKKVLEKEGKCASPWKKINIKKNVSSCWNFIIVPCDWIFHCLYPILVAEKYMDE